MARGWIALSADTPAEAVDTELHPSPGRGHALQQRNHLEGYQASKTRFQTRRQSLAQRDDNRQIFVVTQTNPFTNAIQGTHLIEVQNQSVSAKKFEGGSGNPIDLGARGTQIGNPDSDGAYYFDVVQRCYDNDCALQYSAKPELSGYFATAADLAAEVVIESEFWKINRYREFIAQKQTGTYAKSFTFTRLDVDARSMKGVIDCLSTISGYGDEYDPNVAMEENTCAKWSDQDDAATSPNWPGDGYDWDEKRFAELRWTFDAAGALYICETQAKTESALATIPVDNASLDNGCNGEAWLTIEEPSRDLDFPVLSQRLADRGGALLHKKGSGSRLTTPGIVRTGKSTAPCPIPLKEILQNDMWEGQRSQTDKDYLAHRFIERVLSTDMLEREQEYHRYHHRKWQCLSHKDIQAIPQILP